MKFPTYPSEGPYKMRKIFIVPFAESKWRLLSLSNDIISKLESEIVPRTV